MKNSIWKNGSWTPSLVGSGIGILCWLIFAIFEKPLGISTTVLKWEGATLSLFAGQEKVASMPYWEKYPPAFEYGFFSVIAVVAGAFASALIAGTIEKETVPKLWKDRFGPSALCKALGAFSGGVILLPGARRLVDTARHWVRDHLPFGTR